MTAHGEQPDPLVGDTLVPFDEASGDGVVTPSAPARGVVGRAGAPVAAPRPGRLVPFGTRAVFGRIRLSGGDVVELDRPVVVGRRPRGVRATDEAPRLVTVESPSSDISRSHVEVRPDADGVVVVDLHSTNGTTLLRGGAAPVQLYPGEHTLVVSGDVVDLGDGVTIAFEDLP
ncbi:FHA domain-containing protein [Microbacterium betulae]|uniref:FHA domain-containing protein n=1 Tax=Microbacterium betulae TaxID=2981139 RepID=A0AA97FFG2_9MICO|nr:FHA domain-containing protein [Microbacterium sp. AB]WOF22661.1 FHA domain-containing protein [Microbacterium sp. AB]